MDFANLEFIPREPESPKIRPMEKKTGKILIVDDDQDILQAARLFLKQHAAFVRTEDHPEVLPEILRQESFDVIFLDMNFKQGETGGEEGIRWLNTILKCDPSAVVVLITAFGDIDLAVKAVRQGASDFILKPWQNEKLLAILSSAMALRRSLVETRVLRTRQKQLSEDMDQPFQDIIGKSEGMMKVFATIQKVAKTDANVLVLGENGTGKELVARELHRQSSRAGEVFLSVDIAALSEPLFESELFGHTKGSFTDARDDRAGRFEVASGGTLFLDEIGNISLPLQAKLLRALETRSVTRIGSNRPIDVDVRLICATNMPIHALVGQGRFRQDLLYRINTVEIDLPPLRERKEDIGLLVDHFLGRFCKKYNRPSHRLGAATLKRLETYGWPGNIRELQHAIERAVIMGESRVLEPSDFFLPRREAETSVPEKETESLEDQEKRMIRKALEKHQGNVSHAAGELGLSRAALYRRMERYGF